MWRSPFLSSPSLLAAITVWAAGCSDDDCGAMGAPADGLIVSSVDITLTYGQMTSRAGSDCPDPAAPEGVIAVTIEGRQTDGTGFITLCVPRPDLLETGNRSLGHTASTADIRIIDLDGAANNCTYKIDKTRLPTGKGIGIGVCGNGTDSAGFGLDLDGAISLTRTCGATVDTIGVKLAGKFAIAAEPKR
jgi:hypothetical protein